jgi:hypothetical protein
MEMKDFYYFGSQYLSSSLRVKSIGIDEEDGRLARHADHDNLIQSKYEGIQFPVAFQQVSGKKFTDILNTGWPSFYLISDKFKNLLEEHHFTGWTTYPIIIRDKKGNQIEGYHGFSVTGVSGPISHANSPSFEARYVPTGPLVRFYKGGNVDLNKWDGSDFFVPEGTTGIYITKKVAEELERNKITNLRLTNLAEEEVNANMMDRLEGRKKME